MSACEGESYKSGRNSAAGTLRFPHPTAFLGMRRTSVMRFLDTNVLLYSISTVTGEREKAHIARNLLESADLALSTQVLQEFVVQATRASRADRLEIGVALALTETWTRYPVLETSVDLVFRAGRSAERWQISYWDAAIIEAARQLGCRQLLSEDLNAGQDFAGVTVVNPFGKETS